MLFVLIAIIWLSVLTLVLSLCMIAARSDAPGALSEGPCADPRTDAAPNRAAFK
jgi:hypothetical protein